MHNSSLGANSMLGSKTAAQYISFMQELRSITQQGTQQAVKDYANEDSLVSYVLTMARDCEATDHRDKLFAFHHLVRLWNRPDYGMDIELLYKLFAVQYLQRIAYAISEFSCDEVKLFKRQLEFVYSAGLCNQRLNLPSWTPDWSVPWQARPLWLDAKCYSAGGSDLKELAPVKEVDVNGEHQFRLPVSAKLFDRVLAAGSEALRLSSRGSQELPEALRAWLFKSKSILHVNRNRPRPYDDENVAFARTITAEQDQSGNKLTIEDSTARYETLLEFLRQADDDAPRPSNAHEHDRLYYSVASFLRGRVFFLTEKGYFGLAQEGVAWGDRIAIVRGAPVPFVFRPGLSTGVHSQEYRTLCECFVLGIMDGEAWADDSIPKETVVLV